MPTIDTYIQRLKERGEMDPERGFSWKVPDEGKEIAAWIESYEHQWDAMDDLMYLAAHMWRDLKAANTVLPGQNPTSEAREA
jgi:hypothetical protein